MEFESLNIRDGDGSRRWEEAGRPVVPSLVVDGQALPILHVSQLASLLGIAAPAAEKATRAASDTVAVLRAWLEHVHAVEWPLLVKPTPSRGRTLRELTVNVFHPFELLPSAWETGRFDWYPERDAEREAGLDTAEAVGEFAQRAYDGWNVFLLETGDELDSRDPEIDSPRGTVTYSTLLAAQRWHAAFHYRQLAEFLRREGVELRHVLPLERLVGLELPEEVF